jgi:hypothetical protein
MNGMMAIHGRMQSLDVSFSLSLSSTNISGVRAPGRKVSVKTWRILRHNSCDEQKKFIPQLFTFGLSMLML